MGGMDFAVSKNYHTVPMYICSKFYSTMHSEGGNVGARHCCCCCRCCVAAVVVSPPLFPQLPPPAVAVIAIRSLHRFVQEASEMFPCFVLIVSPAIANNSRGEYG